MKPFRFLSIVFFITFVSLVYVHQQIELVKQSYKIQSNEERLNDLLDQNAILKYNVIALKAPQNLESRLQARNVKLVMPERGQVVRLVSTGDERKYSARDRKTLTYSFLKFFTVGREAEAKPID